MHERSYMSSNRPFKLLGADKITVASGVITRVIRISGITVRRETGISKNFINPNNPPMKKTNIILILISLMICQYELEAQDNAKVRFGKITASDFKLPDQQFDTGANVIIIADIGTVKFEGNSQGFFTLIFTHFMRVKILNKNGFQAGSREISLYHNNKGDYEKLTELKASTFNIENGVVKETKLDEKSVFTEKYNDNIDDKKFAMPALKEGAIFDLEYTVKSPYAERLMPWEFQGEYPRLWSEFIVTIPPPLHYMMRVSGDNHFFVDTTMSIFEKYGVTVSNGTEDVDDHYRISGNSTYRRWVKRNVPALHEEPFTTTIDNYNSKVIFQLNYLQWDKSSDKHFYISTWTVCAKELMLNERFGMTLNEVNGWMDNEVSSIIQGSQYVEDKSKKIFYYVKNNFKVTSQNGYGERGLYTHQSLKDLFRKKEGNIAEINLLLTAMLRKAGVSADPMILSTRDHGIAASTYPLLSEYNYVICVAFLGDKMVTLDASQPSIGFGELPLYCYNGWGHLINEQKPIPMLFTPDSLRENKMTSVIIVNDDQGKSSGGYSCSFGRVESKEVRNEILGSSIKGFEKKLLTESENFSKIENFGVDSLRKPEYPLGIHYDFDLKNENGADIIYFTPMVSDAHQHNPFRAMERHYPVEMPYLVDETYLLNMDIPAGYIVDEIPQSARVAFNENEGMFEYLIQKSQTKIQMRVTLKLNKAFFPTEDYSSLRDFYAFVVKKENEQIVFKKNPSSASR
jgi:hypothetical protein